MNPRSLPTLTTYRRVHRDTDAQPPLIACEGDVSGVGERVERIDQPVRRDMDGIPAD